MSVRIKVKLGEVEIECEGTETFVRTELLDIARDLVHLMSGRMPAGTPVGGTSDASAVAVVASVPASECEPVASTGMGVDDASSPVVSAKLSMSEVAGRLGTKSGSDLLVAAAAYRTLILGVPAFKRGDLLAAMRQASDHYKRSYTNNLSGYISTLVRRDAFVAREDGMYELALVVREELASQLGAE